MRILVAGSSGFLGRHLVSHLTARGHDVRRLVRRAPDGPDEVSWDPQAGTLDPAEVDASDAVVNLAGSPMVGNPYSASWRRELRESRVDTTSLLARTIAAGERRPAFLAGNGISFYGDHGSERLDEDADSRGDALLTSVCREWQAAAEPAAEAGARVCVLRTSPVLDRDSAPVSMMSLPWRLGLGARLGDGHQYFPCISLRDWLAAVTFLAEHDEVSGPVNLCLPDTPTNAELTDALAGAVGRKARLFVPRLLLDTAGGQLAPMLLDSINAAPAALLEAGFEFADADVRDALAAALAGSRS